MKKFFDKNGDYFYFAFRVIVGVLFILHGWMKLGMFKADPISLMALAFLIEVIGGLFIVVGAFVRCTAVIAGIEMIFAYFMAHAGTALSPLANKGEPAVLFFAAFLVLAAFGARKWALKSD
ncbi:MAG TPA: DoxX family protein [Candidatus Nanoarchaeia archaeon]|nr:DoxX family protein [Candidatus Nanoarchaeia archaeon]